MKPSPLSLGRFALQGAIFGFSAAIMVVIVSIVYAAASWGSLPTVSSGSGLTATSWNDLVTHVNQSVKQVSQVITVSGSNVGIGMATPNYNLHIQRNGTNGTTALERSVNTSSNALHYLTNTVSDWLIGERGTSDSDFHVFSFGTSADAITVLKLSGNVGIGATSPGGKLDIAQTADAPTLKVLSNQSNYLSSSQSALQITTTNGTSNPTASYALSATYNGANLIHVRNDGKIGIGITTPSERLDLGGGNIKMGYEIITALYTGTTWTAGWYYANCPAGKFVIGGTCSSSSGTAPTNTDLSGTAFGCYLPTGYEAQTYQIKAICANMR